MIEIAEESWADQDEIHNQVLREGFSAVAIRGMYTQRFQKMIMIVQQTDHSYPNTPIDILRRSLHSKLFHRNR